ncbi:MAG: acyltransferase family protein [Hydrogenophaga sp.]|uniref:acyltransferase family protein n=1 Tax=Hydrogenophaga sp. TaxID=1904254 RepID=UPI002604EFDB|nr:acyltransferase family protein [Hydrogenophaga sp.]MDM7944116.1 acyltransferase family protein [Hydrogenophaga sp.]
MNTSAQAASADARLPFIDALKAIGSQLIVLHHLAFYGPMSDWTHQLAPGLVGWFSQHARMAVQIFLVVAGFLAARSLAPDGSLRTGRPLALLGQRFVRVSLPLMAALLLAMVCTEVARQWMTHDSLPAPPGLWQFVAHALLVHSLLGVDSLSAGVWYVAIDVQLFALLLGLLWLGRRWGAAAPLLVAAVVLASLFHFNRDSAWDNWAIYFFGAYGLGALAFWVSRADAGHSAPAWLAAMALFTALALALDWRTRIALALGVALALAWAHRSGWLFRWPRSRALAYLGRISYAVFLLNFPVALVVNAWFTRYASPDAGVQTLGVAVAWLACNLAGAAFHHGVEQRLLRRDGATPTSR